MRGEKMKTLKLQLAAARTNVGYSQEEAAQLLGLKTSTLATWERDSTKLSYIEANKLADLYGIEPNALFFGDKNEFIRLARNKAKKRVQRRKAKKHEDD